MGAHRQAHRAYPRRPRVDLPGMRGRARADVWPLIVAIGVVALTSLLASVTPRLVDRTADAALRDALASTGLHTELAVTVPFVEDAYQPRTLDPDLAIQVNDPGAALAAALPADLTGVLAAPVATVTTTPLPMTLGRTDLGAVTMTFAYIARGGEPRVRWLDGGPPTAAPVVSAGGPDERETWSLEVALSRDTAARLAVHAGDRLPVVDLVSSPIEVTVSGVFVPDDAQDAIWSHVPGVVEPVSVGAHVTTETEVTALVAATFLPAMVADLPVGSSTRTYTFDVAPRAVHAKDIERVVTALAGVKVRPEVLGTPWELPSVTSALDTVLVAASSHIRAGQAQASVVLAGVVAAAGSTLLLVGQLLSRRRAVQLSQYRARGGALTGLAVELGAEALAVAALGCAVGLTVAAAIVPGAVAWWWVLPGVLLAVVAPPAYGVRVAARASGGKRIPAERSHRRLAIRDRHLQRIAVEGAVVLAAVGAVAALRARGVVPSASDQGGDLLLAAAPSLGVLAGAALLARVLPLALRGMGALAARSRGAVPVLAAARAQATAGQILPIVALTLATGLVTFGSAIGTTVDRGQVAGSWSAVGADVVATVSVDGAATDAVAQVATQPGVTAAVAGTVEDVQIRSASGGHQVRLMVVGAGDLARLLAAVPVPLGPHGQLAAASGSDLGVLLGADLRAGGDEALSVLWQGTWVDVHPTGDAPLLGSDAADLVVVDAGSLSSAVGVTVVPNTVWVVGPGARAAVAAVPQLAQADVLYRSEWLARQRSAPLTAGLGHLVSATTAVLVLLAILMVVLAASASTPERGAMLATLRTIGLGRGQVTRIAIGELLPPVLAAGTAGIGLGVLLAVLVSGSLGLGFATGQTVDPALAIAGWAPLPVAALALVVAVVVVAESSLTRRERLGEVLRAGAR
jgi:putative ABC transport system permease protein